MSEVIQVEDKYYISAGSALVDTRNLVLKNGETFAVFDRNGDVQVLGQEGVQGIYHEGTRFLSRLSLRLGKERPMLLSSSIKEDNVILGADLTNPDLPANGRPGIPRGSLHLSRTKFLWRGVCYERLRLTNHGLHPVEIPLTLSFQADYHDIFEVRGMRRLRRGRKLEPQVGPSGVVLQYEGLDHLVRRTQLDFSPAPQGLSETEARFLVALPPKGEQTLEMTIACGASAIPEPVSFELAQLQANNALRAAKFQSAEIRSSNSQFNSWINRSLSDLEMMVTDTEDGPYPYAGVPWFSTPFGRDGIITALELLWSNPAIAKGVLGYLAATQATETNPEQDAEPGKILHETRRGEMPALGEVPFQRYYGSVDSTPLFVLLAGAYYERTGDLPFVESLWGSIEAALGWMDIFGDADGDGFVEYNQRSSNGLAQQGWKDSEDSVFWADGRVAKERIALCEVQGYVYAAKRRAAGLAAVLGKTVQAKELLRQAHALQERFEQAFWNEELGTYALALDAEKNQCAVRSSNAGHCLFAGIASPERAERVVRALMRKDFFAGWGIRTVSSLELRYNPLSYHNGSIWPHDNGLIAAGFARYGYTEQVLRLFEGMFDASLYVDMHRMPELICGFHRRAGEGPTLYPVACAPQSWAAAAVFLFLQSCLGMTIKAPKGQVVFHHPLLPTFLDELQIRNLSVGDASLDLLLHRREQDVGIDILRREGPLELIVVK